MVCEGAWTESKALWQSKTAYQPESEAGGAATGGTVRKRPSAQTIA